MSEPGRVELNHIKQLLQWRHNERIGVSNHQPHDCLLNRLFRPRSKNSPHKGPVMRKVFPFDDVIMMGYNGAYWVYSCCGHSGSPLWSFDIFLLCHWFSSGIPWSPIKMGAITFWMEQPSYIFFMVVSHLHALTLFTVSWALKISTCN